MRSAPRGAASRSIAAGGAGSPWPATRWRLRRDIRHSADNYSTACITGKLTTVNRLGDLERAIMDVLWETDAPLTVREVSARLTERNLAHTTVMTVLDRLAKKGFARRQRDGRAWRYCPAATRETYVTELMLTALDQTGDRTAALTRFAQSVSGVEADVLRDALEVIEGDGGIDERAG